MALKWINKTYNIYWYIDISSLYIDIYLDIDDVWQFCSKIYDKRNDFNFTSN